MDKREKKIYLTFDDGPIPEITPWVLDQLKENDVKATFFCIGDNIFKHPAIFKRIKEEGHQVGNHTYNHLNGWNSNVEVYAENVAKCEVLTQTKLFRPPYGRITPNKVKALAKYKIVMWSVLTADFDSSVSPVQCLHYAIDNAGPGSIVVFHDSVKAWKNLKYALPIALKHWKEKGYEFGLL